MAKLYVTQAERMANVDFGPPIPSIEYPPLVDCQVLDYSGGAQSLKLHKNTRVIRVSTDAACHFAITNTGRAATTNDDRMAAGQTEFPGISNRGEVTISVIAGS